MDSSTTQITISIPLVIKGLIGLGSILGVMLLGLGGRSLYRALIARLPLPWQDIYDRLIVPDLFLLCLSVILGVIDVVLIYLSLNSWWWIGETALGLLLVIFLILLGTRFFARLFDRYLLDTAIKSRQKVNSEFLNVTKAIANGLLVIIIVIIFAQVHRFNIVGLLASLGVGGLAIAFAAQQTLEQILGGIVIYLDRPFVVDDYIGLPDGIFGRVESIGMRSTKIRTSGKGTLMIVPNSALASTNIENYTSAKKVISLVYLTFNRLVEDTEKAFFRQIILDSTKDILGIDPRSTEVIFQEICNNKNQPITQAQINFFILGTGDFSMDLRKQVLEIANQNINRQLTEFGVEFSIEERSLNVDSPITI